MVIDWRKEFRDLNREILAESERTYDAARFCKQQGRYSEAEAYRRIANRLRRIHAGESPHNLVEDLLASIRIAKRGKA